VHRPLREHSLLREVAAGRRRWARIGAGSGERRSM
jgi:hypothetical protein